MRSLYAIGLSGLFALGCATGSQASVTEAGPDGDQLAQLLAQVASLRAKKTIESYEKAVALLAQVVELDPAKEELAREVQGEFDEYLWSLHLKFTRDGEELQRRLSEQAPALRPMPPSRPPP